MVDVQNAVAMLTLILSMFLLELYRNMEAKVRTSQWRGDIISETRCEDRNGKPTRRMDKKQEILESGHDGHGRKFLPTS